jgi:hypothetical protein
MRSLAFLLPVVLLIFFSCFGGSGGSGGGSGQDPEEPYTVTAVQVDTKPVKLRYGEGSFAENDFTLHDHTGLPLREQEDYEFGSPLAGGAYDIFDSGVSGALGKYKYMRIVVNGKNILADMNIIPMAHDLTTYVTPPGRTAYIDPYRGRFVLPRPVYWSKCESLAEMTTTPQLKPDSEVTTATSGTITTENFSPGKYGNCLYRYSYSHAIGNEIKQASGTRTINIPSINANSVEGTITFWGRVHGTGIIIGDCRSEGTGEISIYLTSGTYIVIRNRNEENSDIDNSCYLYVNNILAASAPIERNEWAHYYIIWGSLSDNCSVRVFKNNTEILNSTMRMEPEIAFTRQIKTTARSYAKSQFMFAVSLHSYGYGYSYIDNIKIYDHIVSYDPSWAMGENALHEIYGGDSGYISDFSRDDSFVSYFSEE